MKQVFTIYHGNKVHYSLQGDYIPWDVSYKWGSHIADKYSFSETRAHYWIWKNLAPLSYVGFQHYRRWMDLESLTREPSDHVYINDSEIFRSVSQARKIPECITNFDIIVPRAWELSTSIGDQYSTSHNPIHWGILLDVFPDFRNLAENEFRYNVCNIFLMRWREFERYMSFWWELIREVEERINYENPPPPPPDYQSRAIGFLSERIFSLWLKQQKSVRNLKIAEVPLIMDLSINL